MSAELTQMLMQARQSLEWFGLHCLRIRDKAGQLQPFVMNEAQAILHAKLEQQRAEKGWVRAIILKGRQLGCSTYTAGRYYHRTSLHRGVNTYILSHEQAASDSLFDMVDRMQANNPLRPHVGVANVKELEFDRLGSSYAVATAGNKATGRGKSLTLYHGSEVAFWTNAPEHFASSVQAVPTLPGTEIILESTSAGASGEFYERFVDAESGRGDYMAVFLPWWLDSVYQREPPPGFVLSAEADSGFMSEQEYADTYRLSNARMAWRRAKIAELRSPLLFQREYPADSSEAWTAAADHEPYIAALAVMRARKRDTPGGGPLIIGVDPASGGGDRFAIAARRGSRVEWVRFRNKINHIEASAWIAQIAREEKPARINIDAGSIGAAVITQLRSGDVTLAELVRGVDFGATSQAKLARPKVPGPKNRRAEMWMRLRDWLDGEEAPDIPDLPELQADLTAPRERPLPSNDFLLESKKDMKARGVRSPDLADAVALTFASNEFFRHYSDAPQRPQFGGVDERAAPAYVPVSLPSGPNSWMSGIIVAVASSSLLLFTLTRGFA